MKKFSMSLSVCIAHCLTRQSVHKTGKKKANIIATPRATDRGITLPGQERWKDQVAEISSHWPHCMLPFSSFWAITSVIKHFPSCRCMAGPCSAQTGERGVAHVLATVSGDNFLWISQFPGLTLEH